MEWVPPQSDPTKLELLEDISRQIQNPKRRVSLPDATLGDEIEQTYSRYQASYHRLLSLRSQRLALTESCKQKEAALRALLRDAYQLVRRQRRNPAFPSSLFVLFGLRADGLQTPLARRLPVPIQVALKVIAADQEARNDGFPVLTDPTPAQLLASVQELRAEKDALQILRTQEPLALAELRQLRQQTHHLFLRTRTLIRLAMIGASIAARQEVLQDFGFKYRTCPKVLADRALNLQAGALEAKPEQVLDRQENRAAEAGTTEPVATAAVAASCEVPAATSDSASQPTGLPAEPSPTEHAALPARQQLQNPSPPLQQVRQQALARKAQIVPPHLPVDLRRSPDEMRRRRAELGEEARERQFFSRIGASAV